MLTEHHSMCHRAKHSIFALQWVISFALQQSLKVNAGENCPSCQEAASWVLKPSLLFTIWLQRHRHHVNCFVKGDTDWLSGPSIQSNVWFTKAKSSHIPSKWQNLDSKQDCSTSLQYIKCLYAPHHHRYQCLYPWPHKTWPKWFTALDFVGHG